MTEWQYEPAADLEATLVERLRRFPREPDMTIYALRTLAALCLRGWLRVYHRLRVTGREHLPTDGSFIMVANHCSHLDAPCLAAALPLRALHRTFPIAAQDYFFVNARRTMLSAIVINALPFARHTHIRHSIEICQQVLANQGNILIAFPEGTRSVSGDLGTFKPGIGLLAAGMRIPVVPCYLAGTRAAWPKHQRMPRPWGVELRIGTPRTYETFSHDKESADRICADLRNAITELMTERGG